MSTGADLELEIAVIGAGVVGCATALALARRSVSVALLEAETEPGLGASGTNSGILHTGFDSPPGELETEMILRSAALRDSVIEALGIPVLRCGAVMPRPPDKTRESLVEGARRNGVTVIERPDGDLEIPGEAVTDPVAYTLVLAEAAVACGTELRVRSRVEAIEAAADGVTIRTAGGETLRCRVVVNCAGLRADEVARLVGDDTLEIYPRKGEFLVFDPPTGDQLDRILLPAPTKRTKGVLVFPTLDGKVVAGPTAADQEDKQDWSVRPQALDEILPKAYQLYPPLEGAEPIAAYAGLRPAGRGVNYVIARSRTCPRLINVAAIRSTGLSASLGIAERVAELAQMGSAPERELPPPTPPGTDTPWWRRTAEHRMAQA